MKIFYTILFSLLLHTYARANSDSSFKPSIQTALFHERVDEAQAWLMAKGGSGNTPPKVGSLPEPGGRFVTVAYGVIDSIQRQVESSEVANNQKARYLRGLSDLLWSYSKSLSGKRISWSQLPVLVNSFREAITHEIAGRSILPAVEKYRYTIGRMLLKNMAFENNPGLQDAREFVFLKLLAEKPNDIMRELLRDDSYSYADSLLVVAARRVPEDLFTSAQARDSKLGRKVTELSSTDSTVKLVAELAEKPTGQMYLPFLARLINGELSQDSIARVISAPAHYYKLLVQTAIEYAGMRLRGTEPPGANALATMLKQKSGELYVNTINGLHDFPAATRFRSIQKLTSPELYYLVVMNEETIYTSSYIYVYQQIFYRLPVKNTDTLLHLVNYDRYKKFITMAANYNKLSDLLGRMNKDKAADLMTGFVNNLDKGNSSEDVEDAVDVANAFATIAQQEIKDLMLQLVTRNESLAKDAGNLRAYQIYRIEKLVMESADSSKHVSLTDSLGIPAVYDITNDLLKDSAGRIIMHMFFLDDGSGKRDFSVLLRLFGNRKKWAMASTPDWVQFSSINTKVPFILFANRPLDSKNDEDDKAQKNLAAYLATNQILPSITVHRGHSFSLKYTIQKMLPGKRVVVLGSCGAYQNLADILNVAPDASIISSKQVGYSEINVPIFMYLVENLKAGKDINWPQMQKNISYIIGYGRNGGFDDYVFPHQNLGSIFLKAYKIAMQQSGESADY